jgi:two-component system, cell cycle response regulator DivK
MDDLAFVIDDNPVNRKLASAFLKRLGWKVEEFEGALPMLERLETVRPRVMLLDISMPGMSGSEACRKMRAHPEWTSLRVIAYTAHAREDERDTFISEGFNEVLIKPVSLDRLSDVVGAP